MENKQQTAKEEIIQLLQEYEYSDKELVEVRRVVYNIGEFRKRFLQPKKRHAPVVQLE